MKSKYVDEYNHDQWADEYDADVKDESHPIREGYEAALNWVIAQSQISDASSVLELGSGTGNLTGKIKDCHKITCVDVSEKMEALAATKTRHLKKEFIASDILEVFEQDLGRFDAIISTYSIHHLTDSEKPLLFDKIWEALKPRGKAVFGDLMMNSLKERDSKIEYYSKKGLEDVAEAIEEEFFWDLEASTQKLESIGFVVDSTQFSDLSFGIVAKKP
jgi:putative AdoMet-dependent methyltransferase